VPKFGKGWRLACALAAGVVATPTLAQSIAALPDQTSRIRLSNHDVNHIVCLGADVEDVKFSAEKGLAVERGGPDAWIKFLVHETDDAGVKTRTYVTTPSEFFVACNGAVYPLYVEPADIPAQTVTLVPGAPQRARTNDALLGPERAVSIALAMLQDRVPASFSEVAPSTARLVVADIPSATITERRHLAIEGSGLSASEYSITATAPVTLDERAFLDRAPAPSSGSLGSCCAAISAHKLS
jgi:conjugal transfer pilus assembly protein TraK